jgi:hypothetical protein
MALESGTEADGSNTAMMFDDLNNAEEDDVTEEDTASSDAYAWILEAMMAGKKKKSDGDNGATGPQ